MLGVVIQIDGWDPVANVAVTLRAASHDRAELCHLDAQTWWPAIEKLPKLGYDLFDGAFEGRIATPSASMSLSVAPWPTFSRLALADARLRLWTGEVGGAWATWTQRVDARVSQQPEVADGRAELTFAVDDRWLDRALLKLYAGTTGPEGAAGLKGQAKPLAIGAPRYVPGVLVDPLNSVFQISGHGAIAGVEAALERLVRFGPSMGDYANFAALVAANIPAGRWATSLAGGWARFGAPPTGQISFLVRGDISGPDGWARRPGQVIRRLALLSGGAGRIADASLNALDGTRPYNLSIYLDQQTTARELIQQLAAGVNAVAGVSWMGRLFVLPVAIGAASLTLAADGTALPPVSKVRQLEIAAPFGKLAITAERAWAVHPLTEIAFTAPLVDMGDFSAATTYREGNIVSAADGSRWIYTAAVPSAGNVPAAGSAFWTAYAAAPSFTYEDGTPIEALKPAGPNADKTSENTAKDTASIGGKPTQDVLAEIAAAKARHDQLDTVIIPAINTAADEAAGRITAARDRADAAYGRADKAITDADTVNRRVDQLIAEGGGGSEGVDSVARAEIKRVDEAAIAGDLAVARSVDTLVSVSKQGSLVPNANFAVWPEATGLPARWSPWFQPIDMTRRANGYAEGGYVASIYTPADYSGGIVSGPIGGGAAGWYVMEADIELQDGDLEGSGITVDGVYNIKFATSPDTAGVISPFGKLQRRRWSLLFYADRPIISFHIMPGWHGFAPITAKRVNWHSASLRAATDMEIATKKVVDTTIPAFEAKYNREIATLTEADAALARESVAIEARMGDRVTSSARDVTTAFTKADEALAGRQTAIEAVASVPKASGLVPNANFAVWPEATGLPARWAPWFQPIDMTRRANGYIEGGYVAHIYTPADWSGGIVSGPIGGGVAGWYVMEADIELQDGDLEGSGITVDGVYNIKFATSPDTAGVVSPFGKLQRRRWSLLFYADRPIYSFHIMPGWHGFAPITAKRVNWHSASLRAATDMEIATKKVVDVTVPAVAARVKANEDALADMPNRYAAAQRTAALEAQVNFAADSGLQRTINARIEDRAAAIADGKVGAVVQDVSNLRSEYNGTKGEVSRQAGVIVNLEGKASAYVRLVTDAGNGRAALSLWSDQFGGAWQLTGNGAIDGNLTINGTITARAFNGASMAREAAASWTGSIRPAEGQTVTVPWSLAIPSIPPQGRFIYEYRVSIQTNAGQSQYSGTDNRGRPITTHYIADGGVTVSASDPQGNRYVPQANSSQRVLAQQDFTPTFTATVTRGSQYQIEDNGDYVSIYVSAYYEINLLDLKVTWVAI